MQILIRVGYFDNRFYTKNIRLSTEGVCTTNGTESFAFLGDLNMRQSILGFNQAKAVELGLTVSDLLLLQYIMYANGEPTMKHIVENEIAYVWLQHQKVMEDLPILNISEGTLRNKLTQFRNAGLIQSKTIANCGGRGSRTYYTVTELTMSLINDTVMTTSQNNDTVTEPCHEKMTSNIELDTNKKLESISKDISKPATPFLGSAKPKTPPKKVAEEKPKKLSLYDKCVAEIYTFTENTELQECLLKYLPIRLAMKDKPIYGLNQWTGMLNKLRGMKNQVAVVKTSTEHGWASFYDNSQNFNVGKDVFSEYGTVKSEKGKDDEFYGSF